MASDRKSTGIAASWVSNAHGKPLLPPDSSRSPRAHGRWTESDHVSLPEPFTVEPWERPGSCAHPWAEGGRSLVGSPGAVAEVGAVGVGRECLSPDGSDSLIFNICVCDSLRDVKRKNPADSHSANCPHSRKSEGNFKISSGTLFCD